MWSRREREDLLVWSDELQQRGDPWGELVATSLAHAAAPTPELAERLTLLQREVFEPCVAPLLHPCVHPHFEHGALVGLQVGTLDAERAKPAIASATTLLRLPCARFVWRVFVTLPWQSHDDIPTMLLDPRVVARPLVVRIGDPKLPTRHVPLRGAGPGLYGMPSVELSALERGLIDLLVQDARFELPWAAGDGGSRLAAVRRLAARVGHAEGGLPALERTLLGRAMWDRSLRVRLEVLDILAGLGREAAPFVPSLIAQQREDARWLARAHEVLASLANDDELVACVADNVAVEQPRTLDWLEQLGALDDTLLDRIEGMLQTRDSLPGWLAVTIQTLLRRHRPPRLVPSPAVEAQTSWLGRLRSWLRGDSQA